MPDHASLLVPRVCFDISQTAVTTFAPRVSQFSFRYSDHLSYVILAAPVVNKNSEASTMFAYR